MVMAMLAAAIMMILLCMLLSLFWLRLVCWCTHTIGQLYSDPNCILYRSQSMQALGLKLEIRVKFFVYGFCKSLACGLFSLLLIIRFSKRSNAEYNIDAMWYTSSALRSVSYGDTSAGASEQHIYLHTITQSKSLQFSKFFEFIQVFSLSLTLPLFLYCLFRNSRTKTIILFTSALLLLSRSRSLFIFKTAISCNLNLMPFVVVFFLFHFFFLNANRS